MGAFLFYCGTDDTVLRSVGNSAQSHWGSISTAACGPFRVFVRASDAGHVLASSEEGLCAVAGYVRSDDVERQRCGLGPSDDIHNQAFLAEVVVRSGWPMDDRWTGSFAAVGFSAPGNRLVLGNDVLGYVPLYLAQCSNGWAGGTHLIPLARAIRCSPDPVGVVQRITPPHCLYGRRTLVREVERLLPGELCSIDVQTGRRACRYDNSLCGTVLPREMDSLARLVWGTLKRETLLLQGHAAGVCLGLSGGWDSRLVLAALAESGPIVRTVTYGDGSEHEVRTAAACARSVGCSHAVMPLAGRYFPDADDMRELVQECEYPFYLQWTALLGSGAMRWEACSWMLLGETCESVTAHSIASRHGRTYRMREYLNNLRGRHDSHPPMTPERLTRWRDEIVPPLAERGLRGASGLAQTLSGELTRDDLLDQLMNDIRLSAQRVWDAGPSTDTLAEELFCWLADDRSVSSTQALMLSSRVRTASPGLSLRFLRLVSSIHPECRLRGRLMHSIAKLPDLKDLARLPSAAIPFVGARTPLWLQELVWGARSLADQQLMKRCMRKRNPQLRQRVLRSLDLLSEYVRPESRQAVAGWFSGRWIDPAPYLKMMDDRANFRAWPLINKDIAIPASTSLLLDLCFPE